jgi:hypothetical protein
MKFRRLKQLCAPILALAALVGSGAASASAITFDGPGDTATFLYGATASGANLCADVTYSLTSWSGSSAIFHVSATNCSSGAGQNRLVSFGVGVVDPDLISASVPGVTEWDATANTNFPSFGTVELCNYAGPNCSGGGSLGVNMGATDQFDLTLIFASTVGRESPITFSSPFASKWQSVGTTGGSVEIEGCLEGSRCTINQVSEPGTLALLGLAAVAFGVARRRKPA